MSSLPVPAGSRLAGGFVLSNPGTGIFVQQAALALYEAGLLRRFLTTIIDRPDSWWRRGGVPGKWLDRRLLRRAVAGFPHALTVTYAPREWLRLLTHRMDRSGVVTDAVWEWAERGFDAWVAKRGLEGAQAVYAYEHAALSTFQAAKERGITCIYDVPSPEHEFAHRVRDEEISAQPELDSAYERRIGRLRSRRTARRRAEWNSADLIITGSAFSKSTYAAAGLDVSKVRIIAPGAPPVQAEATGHGHSLAHSPARFLFVGAVAIHKGAHHLLAAWRQLRVPAGTARLDLIGDISLPRSLRDNCPESVHFLGRLGREEALAHYSLADALVFPTLCDGFGMVVTEAFSRGVPVITTPRAGAAELVREGVNGFVVPAADPEALARTLDWCLTHRPELYDMRAQARATAAAWQWSDYRRQLVGEILLTVDGSANPA